MKSVVILGAGGYIGSYLTKKLSKKYKLKVLLRHSKGAKNFRGLRHVKVFSGDILKTGDLESVIRKGDVVINLSGTTNVAQETRNHFDANVTGQHIVAEACARKEARVVFFSTAHAYKNEKNPSKEIEGLHPQDIYSLSKKLAEEVYEFYSRTRDLSAMIFRLGSVYGPWHRKGVVFTMAQSIKQRGVIEIPRQKVTRDFIYIDDVVRAVEKAIAHSAGGFNVFNIAGGTGHTLAHIAEMICAITKRGTIVRVDKKSHPATIHASIVKSKKELNFKATVGLETGLRRTLLSYKL
ncbi:MAG: NAD(P)-dependent oxidoreductase [bacterium]|nr:NAD(P)-dependent oxidoreductase [bacterium]